MEFGPRRARNSVDRISRVVQASSLSAKPASLSPEPFPAAPGTIPPVGWTASPNRGPQGEHVRHCCLGRCAVGRGRRRRRPCFAVEAVTRSLGQEQSTCLGRSAREGQRSATDHFGDHACGGDDRSPGSVHEQRRTSAAGRCARQDAQGHARSKAGEEPAPTPKREERSPSKPVQSNPFDRSSRNENHATPPLPIVADADAYRGWASALAADEAVRAEKPLAESLQGSAKDAYTSARLLFDNSDFAGAMAKYEQALRVVEGSAAALRHGHLPEEPA